MHKRHTQVASHRTRMPPRFHDTVGQKMKKVMLENEPSRYWTKYDIVTLIHSTGLSREQIQAWAEKRRLDFKNKTNDEWIKFLGKKNGNTKPKAKAPTSAEEPGTSLDIQSDALVLYEPFKPHPDAEDQELELLQVALVNTYLTPEVQQAMDKLCLEWEADDAKLEEEAAAVKKAPYGVVYAVRCQLFGHLIKLGYTMRSPQVRAKELSSTGVPVPYDVVAALYCFNPSQVEKRVHQHFAASRTYGKKKEFFGLTIMQVDRYFTVLAHELIGSDPNLYEPRAKINKRKAEEQDTALKAVRAELAAQSALLKQVLERLPAGSM